MSFPERTLSTVYHIGTFTLTDRPSIPSSLEGPCLSVSCMPLAWQRIAKLGRLPLWRLSRPQSRFLDMLRLLQDRKACADIAAWGEGQGWCQRRTLWQRLYHDDEMGWCTTVHPSPEAAWTEADGDEEGTKVTPVSVVTGSSRLAARVGHRRLDEHDALEYLILVWAEDTQPQWEGVWWDEEYAPQSYSAPRGGVFPGKLSGWALMPLSWQDAPADLNP